MFRGNIEKIVHDDKMEYGQIKNYQLDFEAKNKLNFKFTNLYGGDKTKCKHIKLFNLDIFHFLTESCF